MDKIWYIDIDGNAEGPYTLDELSADSRITPYTLVWKEGYEQWIPAEDIPELAALLKDKGAPPSVEEGDETETAIPEEDELIIEARSGPPYMLFFILIATVLILYLLIKFYMQ